MSLRLVLLATLGIILGLLFAACDDDGDASPAATATPQPATEPTEPTTTEPATEPTPTSDATAATDAAIDALATWLGPVADPTAISVASVASMTWPDGCLGLGRTGQVCTEALVEGYRIDLALGNAVYEVRTDLTGGVTVWAPSVQLLASFELAVTNNVQFTTDDGGTIDAQPVAGTQFGVDLQTLSPGDPVGVGLADAPQREGFLLVWVDPAP